MNRLLLLAVLIGVPVLVTAQPPEDMAPDDKPFARLHTFRPKGSGEAFIFHEQILEQRINQLQQSKFLPEDRKADLVDEFTDELTWFEERKAALEATVSDTDRQAIRQDMIKHIRTARQEHEQNLAKQVVLPQQSPVDTAERIATQFEIIAERLNDENLTASLGQYHAAVAALRIAADSLATAKTVEHIRGLRDAITATRQAGQEVRNQAESLVSEQ